MSAPSGSANSQEASTLSRLLRTRWDPSKDLAAVGVSWLLVVAGLYAATFVAGTEAAGGMAYFALYAIVTATLFGVGVPLYWTVAVRKRPISDLGISSNRLPASLGLQLLLAGLLYIVAYRDTQIPALETLVPLIALALAIGFFEAVFWRGWTQLRLEEAFGIIPGIVIGSALYALYHVGYGMPPSEIVFLFFVGLMFAIVFRLTTSVFILWPIFQPLGQLATLIRDGLSLPLLAAVGFIEVLIAMWALVWLASRYSRRSRGKDSGA